MRRITALAVAASAVLALASSPASAHSVKRIKPYIALEVGVGTSSNFLVDTLGLTLRVDGRYMLSESVDFELVAPASFVSFSPGDSAFKFGNPTLTAHWVSSSKERYLIRVGGGIAIPASTLPDAPLDDRFNAFMAYVTGSLMTGFWDAWLYAPERFSILIPADVMFLVTKQFAVMADLAMSVLIPITGDDDTDFGVQLAVTAAYVSPVFEAGLGFYNAWTPTAGGDNFQASMQPYVGLHLGKIIARLRLVVNLDSPGGFAFDDGRWWSLQLQAGSTL